MSTRKKLIVGNWKMNGSLASNQTLLESLKAQHDPDVAQVAVCPSFPYLSQARAVLGGSSIEWGAQDVSLEASGAFTGDVSAAMLRDLGCRYVIVGHSERRHGRAETDDMVAAKAVRALSSGLTPIVCVGETLQDREAGRAEFVVKRQLSAVIHAVGHCASEIVVAYEPVWAIGSGLSATPEQAQAVHAVLRAQLNAAVPSSARNRILYGGSMNPANAHALLVQPDIDGGLVGGASLIADQFLAIVAACAVAVSSPSE